MIMQGRWLWKTFENKQRRGSVFHCFPRAKRCGLVISVENPQKSVKIVDFIHNVIHNSRFYVDKSTDFLSNLCVFPHCRR